MDDLGRACPAGRSAVRRPAAARTAAASIVTRPLANTRPDSSTTSTALSASKSPSTSRTPAASSDRPSETSARRAPSSTTTRPDAPTANAIQSLRLVSRSARAATSVPDAPSGDRVGDHTRRAGRRDHRAHPRPRRDARRGELGGHAAAAPRRAGAADRGVERLVDRGDLLDERRAAVEARVGGEEAGGVGEHHEHVGRIRLATSAAMRSLSPKRISSSATVSFSLTTAPRRDRAAARTSRARARTASGAGSRTA